MRGEHVGSRIKLEMGIGDLDTRYSFAAQFLMGAAMFSKQARDIEESIDEAEIEEQRVRHRACVVSAIMQSVASIEAEVSEILMYGPGHHLGSNGTNTAALKNLSALSGCFERQSTLDKCQLLLFVLGQTAFDRGAEPFQPTAKLIRLRNELVHYESRWGDELEGAKLITSFKSELKFMPNPLCPGPHNYFPHKLLSSSCACWAVNVASRFIGKIHERLKTPSPLEAYADRLSVPEILWQE